MKIKSQKSFSKAFFLISMAALSSLAVSNLASYAEEEKKISPALNKKIKEEYRAGLEAYTNKNYQFAADHFRKTVDLGNKTPGAWLYAAHSFLALGQYPQAKQTYELVISKFKDAPEADIARKGIESIDAKLAEGKAPKKPAAATDKPKAAAGDPEPKLSDFVTIVPPKMGHPAVSAASIKAVKEALNKVPAHLRQKLIEANVKFNICPNMIDKWPDSLNDLDEEKEELNLAELPGRLYGSDLYIYERAKSRGSTALKAARSPSEMQHTAMNECFQLLDDQMKMSKDPKLLVIYKAEVAGIPETYHGAMANFMKDDDWGPRETCAELTAGMLGAAGDKDSELNRFFPRTKKWLKAKMGL